MKRIFFVIIILGLAASGCKKSFFDINKNPNNPTDENITSDLLLPQAMHETGRIMTQNYFVLAFWMGMWARGGDFGPNPEWETYNITTSFGAGTWSAWYSNLFDYQSIINKTTGTNQNFYQAIARTMRTIGFMHLVDTYDNVPYSQAFELSKNITPAYDKGSDVYKGMLTELDKAMDLLNKVNEGSDLNIENADIMFQGDVAKWKKFINTQRLRLVLRLSKTSLINHAEELAKTTEEGFLMSNETAAVNPGYKQVQNKQNPFWDSYKFTAVGVRVDQYNRANNYALNSLRGVNDIRYQYYYEPALNPVNNNTYYGYNFGENLPNDNPYKSNNSSAVAGKGLALSPEQDQWILTSVESMFMQAEAAQRGYIAGDAESLFKNAIQESYLWLGAPATDAQEYIESGNEYVDWEGSSDKIKLIITQKYFSTIGMNPFESWTDYRRTGFPDDIPLSLASSAGPNIPVRYRYPQSEYNFNPTNVSAQGNPNIFTDKIFWGK